MNYLYQATKGWYYIENIQMNYPDEGDNYRVIVTNRTTSIVTKKDVTVIAIYENSKVGFFKSEEMKETGCGSIIGSCLAYMVNG